MNANLKPVSLSIVCELSGEDVFCIATGDKNWNFVFGKILATGVISWNGK